MLPTYNRLTNSPSSGGGGPNQTGGAVSFVRRSFRTREKCLILLVFVTLAFVCYGGFFYLPDNFGGEKVLKAYKRLRKAGPEIFIPPPPVMQAPGGPIYEHSGEQQQLQNPQRRSDREKLNAKIEEEFGRDILEKPDTSNKQQSDIDGGGGGGGSVVGGGLGIGGGSDPSSKEQKNFVGRAPPTPSSAPPASSSVYSNNEALKFINGEDPDPIMRQRRNKVKEMMILAWDNYKLYAWGKNELKPVSKRPHVGSIFGSYDLGATIIDGLDTLYVMGLNKEFEEGRDWIARRFTLENVSADLSVFETNIRYVGGLLSCYAFTGDPLFKDKAQYVADKLIPAFQTPTGIPNALVNLRTGASKNYGWASGGSSILSEFGTLHLEFSYLSDVTGNPVYRERVQNVRQILKEIEKPNGLYPNYLNPKTGKWGQQHISLGALGDSFYEYLLKAWIQSGQTDTEAREMYDEAMVAIMDKIIQTSPNGLIYTSDMKFDRLEHKMDHLACFSGGLFALGAQTLQNQYSERYMEIGAGITNTCHESYIRTPTHLGPEAFRFSEGVEAKALKTQEKYYILRPETFESYFVLWRLTHDQKYRDWGWDAVLALEKYCRSANGFSGLKNVYLDEPVKDDVQQSFFLAETLKYLYLLFSDDSLLSLDEWTFNTEAHPLPVKGANVHYRMAQPTAASSAQNLP